MSMKRVFSVLFAIIIVIGCLPITTFAVTAYDKNGDTVFFSEDYAQVGVPISVKTTVDDSKELVYKWYINGSEIVNSGDSYTPVEADLECMLTAEAYSADGEKVGAVNMLISKLPVIYIETENRKEINSKDTALKAHMKLQGNSEFNDASVLYDGETEIKGRGNSTWLAAKKPYKLKLDTKSDLLGMGKNKHWVLLSNPYDRSLLRNKLIYDLADDMGINSMSSQWVDVVLNGKVVGNYLLCEHVRIGSTRVDITDWDEIAEDAAKAIYKANKDSMSKEERDELAELLEANMDWVTDGTVTYKGNTYTISDYYELPSTNGGYLLECFGLEQPYFLSGSGFGICVSKPEGIGKSMLSEIQTYYSAFEKAAQAKDFCAEYNGQKVRYSDLADAESFAKGFLLNEIFQNQDFLRASTYMYKDIDGKLFYGPVWDMDMTADNSSDVYSHNKWVCFLRGNIMQMLRDPAFLKIVYDTYREYRYTAIADLVKPNGDFDSAVDLIGESGAANDMIWGNYGDFETYSENFRLWLSRRLDWIDSQTKSFGTFYTSVNGSALNNSGSTTLKLDGSQLKITMNDATVAVCKVLVNGVEKQSLSYSAESVIDLGTLDEGSVVSAMSYDESGSFLGMSTVTNYKEPTGLKITKSPSKTVYNSGDAIELDGLELKAVYSDGSQEVVQPEAVLSYVSDCMGGQNPVYNKITEEIGSTYISLRYRGAKVDFKVTVTPSEDIQTVEKLIDRLPQSDLVDNLDVIFNAKQHYDTLSSSAKAKVSNASALEATMKKIDELSENSDTPILGCYIDRLGRITQKNKVVVIAKGQPNKIRFFLGGSTTTIPVANRDYCISEKQVAGYNIMTIPYYLTGDNIEVGAYYNHIQKGQFYNFNVKRAVENCSQMIKTLKYEKTLASVNSLATLNLTTSSRVEKISAVCDGLEFTETVNNGSGELEMCFNDIGTRNIDISYYADGEWHFYDTISIYVRDESVTKHQLALEYPSETAYDEAQITAATPSYASSVRLISDSETIDLTPVAKNGLKTWSGKVEMTQSKSFKVYVDHQDIGRTIEIEKLDKLVIENGKLIECRVNSGKIDIPFGVTAIADGALDDFTGTICCYRNSAAHKYAEANGIDYINYGCKINVPEELEMNAGEAFVAECVPDPLVAPDFKTAISSNNASSVIGTSDGFKAIKPGYARVTLSCTDGTAFQIKVTVNGGCRKGDINGDGKINSFDALLALRNSVQLNELTEEQAAAADINSDSIVNSHDALLILQISTSQKFIWDFV